MVGPESCEFALNIKLIHPSYDPDKITAALGMEPFRCWQAGRQRATLNGQLLEGAYKETYWCSNSSWIGSTQLDRVLAEQIIFLEKRSAFLSEFQSSGGRIRVDITWATESGNSGFVLESEMIQRAASLKIDLGIDFYATPLLGYSKKIIHQE